MAIRIEGVPAGYWHVRFRAPANCDGITVAEFQSQGYVCGQAGNVKNAKGTERYELFY
ncbi:MAG TPA: hypothetical protein VI358_03615 [Pseudolabrys sp.]